MEEAPGVGPSQMGYVAGPARTHHAVGERRKGRGQERLHQHALRIGLHAHAVLFHHHVALLVEFTEHGLNETLRLQQEP